MRPCYIHTLNLVRTVNHIIRLCEGVLERVPVTHSRIKYLKAIRTKPQSMTKKCHMVRRLNHPRQHIMQLINLSSYFKCNSLKQSHIPLPVKNFFASSYYSGIEPYIVVSISLPCKTSSCTTIMLSTTFILVLLIIYFETNY